MKTYECDRCNRGGFSVWDVVRYRRLDGTRELLCNRCSPENHVVFAEQEEIIEASLSKVETAQ